jgi:hypothetical protein
MLKDLLLYLEKEWTTLKSAPLVFLIALLLVFLVAYLAAKWRYDGLVENLRERLELSKDRIQNKDDQLNEYRQRLHIIPSDTTSFSRMTNSELKSKALQVVLNIRSFLADIQKSDGQLVDQQMSGMRKAQSEEEKNRVWQAYTSRSIQQTLERNSHYDGHFKVDSILLRDELLSRLPKTARDERAYRMYEHPTNPIGMGEVADDLERLAKSLP